MDKKDDTIR